MQAWLEEIKFQQMIKEERKISYKEGTQANAIENAKNLLKMNILTPEQISQGTGIPLEDIEKLALALAQA